MRPRVAIVGCGRLGSACLHALRDSGYPLFVGARTLLFPVDSVARLEREGHGIVFERHGSASAGAHQNILFEARFEVARFAAQVMLDAARRLPRLKAGMHRYSLWTGGPA